MDAGNLSARSPSFSIGKHRRRNSRDDNLDRFIPNRAAMDFDFANYMLTGRKVEKESSSQCTVWGESYQKQLAEVFNINRTRILSFRNKPPLSLDVAKETSPLSPELRSVKRMRHISQSSERTLDAPEILDDYYLNLVDWGVSNILAIGLGNSVYLWDASDGSTSELLSSNDDSGPVTSVKWAPDGGHVAVGFNNSEVQLWDASTIRQLRTLRERHGHGSRVGSLDWNYYILNSGSMDIRSHIIDLTGHTEAIIRRLVD